MREYRYSLSYDDPLLAELYDKSQNYIDDIQLIRGLIKDSPPLKILEVFSGTGRILVPLARDGHTVTGIEISKHMSERVLRKASKIGKSVRERIKLVVQDAMLGNWGSGYDLVILGANCLYELTSADEQQRCIRYASEAVKSLGKIYVDNTDYKGDWGRGPFGRQRVIFEGEGADGTFGRLIKEGIRFDRHSQTLITRRTWFTESPGGEEKVDQYVASQRPVTKDEVQGWLEKYGFEILKTMGSRRGTPYTPESERAIFWGRKL